ncbi:MAG: LPS assembly protein LptD [Gammaproteobacteria bacterium]|nr:LPS assembly protein LptD [Gammaproteobacteria bacterium]
MLAILTGLGIPVQVSAADWQYCPIPLDIPPRPVVDVPLEADDIHLSADEADLVEGGVSVMTGDVELTRGPQQVKADRLEYNQEEDTAALQGDIHYWDDSVFLFSEEAQLQLDEGTGEFTNSDYRIVDNRGRGHADRLFLDIGTRTDLNQVDYSTCDPEDNFWKLSASEISLDHVEEWGSARNVVLKIKDVPVFYSPYMSFPLSDKRKTGFLAPSVGTTNRNGLDVRTPYYWNIAPNMDATFTPRLISNSGLMLMGEYRYLFSRGTGSINLDYLPSDAEFDDEDRHLFNFTHEQTFADTGELYLEYNDISDKEYLEDFGTNIALTSTRFLDRRAEASYQGSWWNASVLVQNYQNVDRSIPLESLPYKRLPRLRFSTDLPRRNRQFNFGVDTEFVYFDRGDNDVVAENDSALRFDLFPYVSYPISSVATFIEPKIGVRYTQYSLTDPLASKHSPSRVLPILSVDSGVFFERETSMFGKNLIQTLEPRIFYLYVPEEDQEDIPVFDTGFYDFSIDSLFRDNRFSGADRQGDTNQITFAVTTRFINDRTGAELGYLSLGQIYYFQDREVTLPGRLTSDEEISPIVAEMQTEVIPNWRIGSEFQWDPNNNSTEKLVAQIQYNPGDGRVINLGYRSRNERNRTRISVFDSLSTPVNIEQTDISFRWPVNPKWSVVGRWNYALPEDRSIEIFGGVEYEDCCWGTRLVARRFLSDIEGEFETGIFLQVELKGLAGVGKKAAEFLEKNIPGYEKSF